MVLQAAAITSLSIVAVYLAIGAGMYVEQRKLMYFPDPVRRNPSEVGLTDVIERELRTPDGQLIIAWFKKAEPGQPTLLYFHGNGGSLASRAERVHQYTERGRGILMMTYRGYGGSTGSPTEIDNVADAKLAYEALVADGVAPGDIILYGESLGTGVAVQVAAAKNVGGIILDAPFSSITDRAAQLYPWLPVRLLLKDRYDSAAVIGQVKAPLLIVHGEADDIVPIELGRALFAKANEPKEFAAFPNAGHEDHYSFGSLETINSWIDRLRSSGTAGRG